MERKKLIILPTLYCFKGNLASKWYVQYSVRNPKTDKMSLFKVYNSLGKFPDVESRTAAAQKIIEEYSQKLKIGWTPFNDDSKVIYEDNLEYDKITRIYGKKRMENKTIRYWASKYIDSLSGSLDESGTLPTYKSKLRIFSSWIDSYFHCQDDISVINNSAVVAFFRWLIDDQKRSGKTIHDYRYIIAGLFEWLIKQKVFMSNPVHDLPVCKRITDMSPIPIHVSDIAIFEEELKNDQQLWLAIQFQFYCALRPGRELRLLKIQDIDFGRGQVTVMRSQAKTKITRVVVIPGQFLEALRGEFHLESYKKGFYVLGKDGVPGPENLGKNNLRFRFNAVRKKLKMPEMYKFYSWKHTGAVEASLSGIPDKHIQMQLGHSSLETTSRYLRKMTGFQSDFLKNQYPGISKKLPEQLPG